METGDQEYEKNEISVGLSDGVILEVIQGIDTSTFIKKIVDEGSGE